MNIKLLIIKIIRRIKTYIWRIKVKSNPNEVHIFTLANGAKFSYPLNTAVGCNLYRNNFEVQELSFFERSIQEGSVVFDIGANGGLYSLIASRKAGKSGNIYAFEPGKAELEILHRNLSINSCDNVEVIEKAVSDHSGQSKFAISKDGAMNSLMETEHLYQSITHWQTIELISLDAFIQHNNISKVDFIKVDVEGAEELVFKGATKLLSSPSPPTLLFEGCNSTLATFGCSAEDLINGIQEFGFSVYSLNFNGELIPVSENNPTMNGKIYNFIAKK
ncbi:FkbM family methyltransferase [Acaryochloris sp. IP29b_bin.148]|uniref:FkbM family methyltransferase n=1 Tax=Acaryochloris sp. IP29b_bin.148 TaxID=2969218 RepID=UPI00262FC195|nr:FkbM family methyltransferase [Acaryochloris sp. IP29b_bin.148]